MAIILQESLRAVFYAPFEATVDNTLAEAVIAKYLPRLE